MELREALYTTRAMRRVSDKPIPQEVQARILDATVRAPSGGNAQNWRFLIVDDPAVKAQLGPIYRECMDLLWAGPYAPRIAAAEADPESEESQQFVRVRSSAQHLADHFEGYPMLLFGFSQHDPSGGSIYPAVWNAMLAAAWRGGRRRPDVGAGVQGRRRAHRARRAARRGLELGCVRHVRLSDRALGRRCPLPGRGGVVPESLG